MDNVENIILSLGELTQDTTMPASVRKRVAGMIINLKDSKIEVALRIDKVMFEISELCEDANIPSFARNQLFMLTSELESMH